MSDQTPEPASPMGLRLPLDARRSRVIKSHEIVDESPFPVFDAAAVRTECERQLAEARLAAEQIRREAEQTAVEAERMAREAGHREGMQQAQSELQRLIEEQAAARLDEHLSSLSNSMQQTLERLQSELERERLQWQRDWERQAVELSLAVAKRIIQREIAGHPELSQEMIRRSLELISGHRHVTVWINPGDLERLGGEDSAFVKQVTRSMDCRVELDDDIEPGGCRVETEHGQLDATRQTQLERIKQELLR